MVGRRRQSHPFENIVIGLTLALAGVVGYYAVRWWLDRPKDGGTKVDVTAPPAVSDQPARLATARVSPKGVSKSFYGVRSIPPMALSRTGHLSIRTKAPPAPKRPEDPR